MDARAQRTQNALRATILSLAQEHEISQISVTQVAQAAQINRVTFYNHATSPLDLLTQALREQLDLVRSHVLDSHQDQSLATTQSSPVRQRPIEELGEHLIVHQVMYRRNITPTGHGAVADFLTQHFAQTVYQHLAEQSRHLATALGAAPEHSQSALDATAQFISHGTIGVIAVWLHDGTELTVQRLVTYLDNLFPAWWIRIADGTTNEQF
ncbi:TetR-like C-terminal domain-containing protein [Jonesiaceae bacterium BS-20]|uniref:TetR-like C-terminal domain-containing protein n=1 Tax=Jonesiaceae bacterium BS-20 TaxID=3120821 RepID=A0AAU7DSB6_9MICO